MTTYHSSTITEGLAFPEAPRWHAGRLWFTDQHARAILAMDTAGECETIAPTEDLPGGLGWLPDGRVLVVFMTQRRVMQLTSEGLAEYADLSDQASFHCNDMVVDAAGRAFVGNFGFDLHGGGDVAPAEIIRIDQDGNVEVFRTRRRLSERQRHYAVGRYLVDRRDLRSPHIRLRVGCRRTGVLAAALGRTWKAYARWDLHGRGSGPVGRLTRHQDPLQGGTGGRHPRSLYDAGDTLRLYAWR